MYNVFIQYIICCFTESDYKGIFMRILVTSDAHGSVRDLENLIEKYSDIKHIFYLGDGVEAVAEIQQFFSDRKFYLVSGNCDFSSQFRGIGEAVINGVRIIYTHGHRYGVKYGTEKLFELARFAGAKLVLYGHTHIQREEYNDGIYVINPGALRGAREGREGYAIIDVSNQGIVTNLLKLN